MIKVATLRTRLSVCTSLVLSRILYMLPLYAGCPDFLLTALQNKQNEAMRLVTNRKREVLGARLTSTRELLRQCGYMSVRQMAFYYSVATVRKTIVHKQPEYLHEVVTSALSSGVKHHYPTSQAGSRQVKAAKLDVANSSFRWRATDQYVRIPTSLKEEPSLKVFLSRMKDHTRADVPI